jgi:hypothetical protein
VRIQGELDQMRTGKEKAKHPMKRDASGVTFVSHPVLHIGIPSPPPRTPA